MQTFLSEPTFWESVMVLDRERLGKQRVEAMQMLNAMHDIFHDNDKGKIVDRPAKGYQNHSAVRMWRGYELALVEYLDLCCKEWQQRGYVSNMHVVADRYAEYFTECGFEWKLPDWWLNEPIKEAIMRSHRSNLVRKDPTYYRKQYPGVPDNLEYVWPVP